MQHREPIMKNAQEAAKVCAEKIANRWDEWDAAAELEAYERAFAGCAVLISKACGLPVADAAQLLYNELSPRGYR
jgi:hypothetical protein